MNAQELSILITELTMPVISVLLGITLALLIKDIAGEIANGISFKYFGPFKEGDKCVLDGHQAVIVKIGLTTTVFGCDDPERGYIWRYVPNDRIGSLSLGKVISSPKKDI